MRPVSGSRLARSYSSAVKVQPLHNAMLETGNLPAGKGSAFEYQFVVPPNATKSNKVSVRRWPEQGTKPSQSETHAGKVRSAIAILSAYFYDSMTPSSHTRIPRIFLVIPKSVVSNAPGGSPGRHVHHGLSFLVHFRSRASKTRGLNNWYRSHLKRIKHYLNIPSASTSNYKEYLIMSPKCQLCIHV